MTFDDYIKANADKLIAESEALNAAYAECDQQIAWATLCKRTEDPKLAYIEELLTERGIPHRRNGESFHAPILEVLEADLATADRILSYPARKQLGLPVRFGVSLDNVPDDHPCFVGYEPHDFDGNEEAEHLAELNRGYAKDRI